MSSKVILVTGANRGIGFAIVQALATAFSQHTYLLGVRSLTSGHEAIKSLQALGLTSTFEAIEIDITSDESLTYAASTINEQYGRLDILINNAAIAEITKPGEEGFRQKCNAILDTNVTSFMQTTSLFLPLLRLSPSPRVITVSSVRGSVQRQTTGKLPPTASIPYTVSKTALNIAMLEMAKLEPNVLFQAVCPGHCNTAFNGYTGPKDPLDGARVVVGVLEADRGDKYGMGFWEFENGEVRSVPW